MAEDTTHGDEWQVRTFKQDESILMPLEAGTYAWEITPPSDVFVVMNGKRYRVILVADVPDGFDPDWYFDEVDDDTRG